MDDVVVVNERDEVIGTMPKDEAHLTGAPHRIAIVYVEDGNGSILVQVRSNGAHDHAAAGHVLPGETYEEAAAREMEEEIGISDVTLEKVGHGVCEHDDRAAGENRVHVFDIFRCIGTPCRLEPSEVESVYWADYREVLSDMRTGASGHAYAGAFRVSLPIYAETVSADRVQ